MRANYYSNPWRSAEDDPQSEKVLETPKLIAINAKFNDLIISLRTAKADNYRLIKTETVFSDVLDAFRLALQYFQLTKE